jgi:transposase
MKRVIFDETIVKHFILAGKNDHEIATELKVSHDRIYRFRRKLERRGEIPARDGARVTKTNYVGARFPIPSKEPTRLKPHEVDAIYNLLNAAQRVDALELENSNLRKELGVLKERYASLELRYNDINKRYQYEITTRKNPPVDND